jgi:hypothetical protein
VAHAAIGGSRTIAVRNNCPARHSRRAVFQSRRLIRNFCFALRMRTNISPFASARNLSCIGSKARDPVVRHTSFAGTKKSSFARFRSALRDTSSSTPFLRPDWFRLAAAPIRLAAASPPSAAAGFQTRTA